MVISPPHNLRAPKLHTHPCSRTSTSREVFSRGEPALTCCRDCSCPPEGRDKPTPWYADVIFLSIEPSTPTGRPRSHLLVDVPPPTPISAQELPAPDLHWRERRTRIKGKGHWDNRQRRPRSHSATAPAFNTHPCSRTHATCIVTRRREGRAHIGLDDVHSAGSTHPCSRTLPSNAFPVAEKTALTFCALSTMFRPNTHCAIPAQEFGQFSSGWESIGRRAHLHSEHPFPLKNLDSS